MLSIDLFLNIFDYLTYDEFEDVISILFSKNKTNFILLYIQRKTKIVDYELLACLSKIISLSFKPTDFMIKKIEKDNILRICHFYYSDRLFWSVYCIYINHDLNLMDFNMYFDHIFGESESYECKTEDKEFCKLTLDIIIWNQK